LQARLEGLLKVGGGQCEGPPQVSRKPGHQKLVMVKGKNTAHCAGELIVTLKYFNEMHKICYMILPFFALDFFLEGGQFRKTVR
jgi:hypothetical protein